MTVAQKVKNMLVWGFLLWLIGYIAGILLYFIVPVDLIGWVLSPIASLFTIWVLFTKVKRPELMCYFGTGLIWTLIAVIMDYIFLVRLFNTGLSYYKPDVFLYYFLTFTLPIIVGYWKYKHKSPKAELF